MKIHIITIGKPKLEYARIGWDEYYRRLERMHQVRFTHIADKYAYDSKYISGIQGSSYRIVLEIKANQMTSQELADRLSKLELQVKEVSFLIGGPEGLPEDIRSSADLKWSFGMLTLPHDLAMVTLLETLYRASSINSGLPYHK